MEKCSDNHGQPPGVHCTSEARVKDCVGAGGGGGIRESDCSSGAEAWS